MRHPLSVRAASALPETLGAAVEAAVEAATSANTRRLYRAQAKLFAGWCAARGLAALPAAPETVAGWLADRAAGGAKVATVRAGRSAVSAMHRAAGAADPAASELARMVMRGLARRHRAPRRQADALDAGAFAAIAATASRPRPRGRGMESPEAARARGAADVAIAGLLFHAGLRRSEAAALEWRDVRPASVPGALLVAVRAGKTNQDGADADVRLVKGAAAAALASIRPPGAQPADRVLGLSDRQISRRLAAAAAAAGLGDGFSGHSGRVGLAVELTRRGASVQDVMLAGGWCSAATVARYAAGVRAEQGAVARYL